MSEKKVFSDKTIKKLKPLDFILFFLFITLGIFLLVSGKNLKSKNITVNANGTIYSYSLKNDGIYSVKGFLGDTIFEIKNGSVRIIDSPCPGKNCLHQGNNLPLVCLPNKVIISADSQGEFDAVAD